MRKQIKNEHRNIQVFTHRTFAVFISLLLLSDVGIAAGRYEVKAQQRNEYLMRDSNYISKGQRNLYGRQLGNGKKR